MAKSLDKLTDDELQARQSELAAEVRTIEDDIEEIGAEIERRAAMENVERVKARLSRELASLPADVRDAAIAGANAGIAADAPQGGKP